jgi:sugar O-acyltransferase (sialic acid O-acetyltransferase NeuD family)
MEEIKLKIYGKGGHAKVINSMISKYATVTLIDDSDYTEDKESLWVIGIGDNATRERIANKLDGIQFGRIIAESSIFNTNQMNVSDGTVIMDGAVIQVDTIIGMHSIINTNANVDHDCRIGDFVHIAPGVTLCGNVTVGDGTFIGAGSTVIPGITIGKNCIIGAGSVVVRDIPDNSKAYGNPCKVK